MIQPPHDPVNRPYHYTFGSIEVIDALEAWDLGFHLGNCVKYVVRAAHKGSLLEDLRKARWYLDREIARKATAAGEPLQAKVSTEITEAYAAGRKFERDLAASYQEHPDSSAEALQDEIERRESAERVVVELQTQLAQLKGPT